MLSSRLVTDYYQQPTEMSLGLDQDSHFRNFRLFLPDNTRTYICMYMRDRKVPINRLLSLATLKTRQNKLGIAAMHSIRLLQGKHLHTYLSVKVSESPGLHLSHPNMQVEMICEQGTDNTNSIQHSRWLLFTL